MSTGAACAKVYYLDIFDRRFPYQLTRKPMIDEENNGAAEVTETPAPETPSEETPAEAPAETPAE